MVTFFWGGGARMHVCERIRQLREGKNLSQGDIEGRTGLLRCYVSRVENGHTVPSLETLEKLARALEVPLYQLFYEGHEVPPARKVFENATRDWASRGSGLRAFERMRQALSQMADPDRNLLLEVTKTVVRQKRTKKS
jgi:transcriptional regulator with XRE-family HTH domain